MNEQHQEGQGRITADDVRAAVESLGGDPSRVNAQQVRGVIGRGSLSTIQRHLVAMRQQPEQQQAATTTIPAPPPPAELIQGLWAAAWAAADAHAARLIAGALARIDELESQLRASADDAAALAEAVDRLETDLTAAREELEDARSRASAADEEKRQAEAERQALAGVLEQLRSLIPGTGSR
jgi:DNA repair exonuclease SbcCD ATPase subunit